MSDPRVTEVLAAEGIIDVSRYHGTEARDRGSIIHAATHYDDIDDLDVSSLDPSIVPYLDGWRKFRADHACVWDEIEVRHIHPTYCFTGQIDRRGLMDSKRVILDIKSGSREPWHPIQLAAYAVLVGDLSALRVVVRLTGDGGYGIDSYGPTTPHDMNIFMSALNIYNWKRGNNGNRVS